MPEYAREGAARTFAQARERYDEIEQWLGSDGAAVLTRAELEDQLASRGRDLLRLLFQGTLDVRALGEHRRGDVVADGVARTRVEKGHSRPLTTVFGETQVARMAYRAPGQRNACPAGAQLNLPAEKHSHGLRRLAAAEAPRGSFEDAAAAIGKRQVEQLAVRAGADIDAFYDERKPGPAPDEQVLVITADAKGIVMRPGGLRPATAKAATAAKNKLATRLSPGEKNGRKRMAELACAYDCAPVPRVPGDVIRPPGTGTPARPAERPGASGKWLTGSVTDDIPAVISAALDEAERRDPRHEREWVVLIDGNNTQIEAVTAEAASRAVRLTIVIDFI